MRIQRLLLNVVYAIFFALMQCGSSVIMQRALCQDIDCSNRKLTILPIPSDAVSIRGKGDIQGTLKDEKVALEKMFQRAVYQTLVDKSPKRVSGVRFTDAHLRYSVLSGQTDTSRFAAVAKRIEKDDTLSTFYVPKKEHPSLSATDLDLGLIINELSIGTDTSIDKGGLNVLVNLAQGKVSGVEVHGPQTQTEVMSHIKFIIWDYKKEDAVCYGSTDAKITFDFSMDGDMWEENFFRIPERIFHSTPFKWKY